MNRIETKLARTAKTAHGERDAIAADFVRSMRARIEYANPGIDARQAEQQTKLGGPNQKENDYARRNQQMPQWTD